ncbi:DEAD/H helicase [Phellopilus nigrolimitatus]|nr:DEAD/H helicase [Phellopilus nigrolimitatus]
MPYTSEPQIKVRRKRKSTFQDSSENPEEQSSTSELKKARIEKTKGKEQERKQNGWPEYFVDALNTVLAFCSSRKHLAITFPVVRSSVEALLKQIRKISLVLRRALLPDLVRFAYIPHEQLRINAESQTDEALRSKGRGKSPDFSAFSRKDASSSSGSSPEDEHVLVLDFAASKGTGKKADTPSFAFQLPPSLSPAAVKKLIEKRNERFEHAVDELLQATPSSDDPVLLVQAAAREHIPVNPSTAKNENWSTSSRLLAVPASKERDTIDEIIEEIKLAEWYKEQIVDRRVFDAKEGRIGNLAVPVSNNIMLALQSSRKISSFYTHQAAAINALLSGRNVIVSTSTASGKSVIYQVPMLRFLEGDPDSTALYIYPTKALAQDQRGALEQLLWSCDGLQHIKVANYDGDTPVDQRTGKNKGRSSSVIFTNFDMLHASILPHEEKWRNYFKNLKLVAVDELHYYSGIFGSHVAYIIRRLRRVCAAVGNRQVRFVSCSATISNPLQHMRNLFGVDNIEVITDDGAPSGKKNFIIWNPPPNDPIDPSLGRHSSLTEATSLMRFLMKKGVRTILFCKYRKICELAMKSMRTQLSAEGRLDILERVMSYRGGLYFLLLSARQFWITVLSHNALTVRPQDRRRIEQEAFSGNLLGIIATNALELGVDIGILDAVIMLGFPFGIASLRQQAGRAGRRARDSLAVLVADSLPLDQHYVQNPNELFDKSIDDILVDLDSKVLLEAHLQCAAYEMPLTVEDEMYFGPQFHELCESRLVKDNEGWQFMPFPSKHVSIRGIQEETYTVVDITNVKSGGDVKLLEEIEVARAMFEAFEGAVFIHQGLTFIVQEISHDSKIARLVRADVNWTTNSRHPFSDIDALQTHRIREIKGSTIRAFYGRVELKTVVFGYFKVRNNVILDTVDLEMPPFERRTTGFWIDVPKATLDILRLKAINAAEAIHGAEHAFLNRFPMAADMKTECKVPVKEYMAADTKRKRPARLIFYDGAGTQGAIAAKAFDHVSDLLHDTFEAVESCNCSEGCADCIRSPYCKEGNVVSSKIGAQIVIRGILGLPIDVQAIPDANVQIGAESIIEAVPVRVVDGVEVELYAD